jgi:FdhD protein
VPTTDAILLTTGRISYEMAVKAAKARVPLVVSRTAVTDLAAEIAGELGITLAGYARGGKITVYTHPGRIVTDTIEGDDA